MILAHLYVSHIMENLVLFLRLYSAGSIPLGYFR